MHVFFCFEGAGDDDFFVSMDADGSGDYESYFLFGSVSPLFLSGVNPKIRLVGREEVVVANKYARINDVSKGGGLTPDHSPPSDTSLTRAYLLATTTSSLPTSYFSIQVSHSFWIHFLRVLFEGAGDDDFFGSMDTDGSGDVDADEAKEFFDSMAKMAAGGEKNKAEL